MNPCDACREQKNVRIHVYANAEETAVMGICIECWADMARARLAGKSPQEWYADATSAQLSESAE